MPNCDSLCFCKPQQVFEEAVVEDVVELSTPLWVAVQRQKDPAAVLDQLSRQWASFPAAQLEEEDETLRNAERCWD
jgi:hypothetical protein